MTQRATNSALILLVDDDPTSRAFINRLLERDGYTVVTADNGEDAIKMAGANPSIDLVVLDVVLPGMNGVEVCRRLKSDAQTALTPIILVSGVHKDDASIQAGLAAGADGYLAKPIDPTALRSWVKAALRIRALQHELVRRAPPTPKTSDEFLRNFAKLSHAINNPLQALYATVDILALSLPKDSEARGLTTEILIQAEKVAELVAQATWQARELLDK